MISFFILYCLWMFFAFYVVNHSPLTEEIREYWSKRLPYWMVYSLECAFCFTFWMGILICIIFDFPLCFAFAAPPVTLFMNLIFKRLKNDKQT